MSAFIVNDETIHVIVKGFEKYETLYFKFEAEGYKRPVQVIIDVEEIRNGIGQALLEQNYKSVNYRYREETETPTYKYDSSEKFNFNDGLLLGCIDCYIYQACETDDFFESKLYKSLLKLKDAMLRKMIEAKGEEITYGYK